MKILGLTVLASQLTPLLRYKDKTRQMLILEHGLIKHGVFNSKTSICIFNSKQNGTLPYNKIVGKIYTSSLNSTKLAQNCIVH